MTTRWANTAAVAFVAGVAAGAFGQEPAGGANPKLTKERRAEVVEAAARTLTDGYLYEDKAKAMAVRLRENLAAGRYDELGEPAAFARRLTDDLQGLCNDKHLRVLLPAAGPVAVGGQPAPVAKKVRRPATRPGHGIARVEVLDGNVGYLDLRAFSGAEGATAKVDAAMALLADVDALVIDLGRNGGGTEDMVRHLSAYLFDRPTHLVNTFMRGMDKPRERWTAETVPGKRLARTPVYLLVGRTRFRPPSRSPSA